MTTYTFCMNEDGKMPVGIKETLARLFPSLAGKKIRLSIEEAKDKRSLDQNAYYRGFVLTHVRHVRLENGDPVSLDQAHEDLLEQFSPRVEGKTLLGKPYSRAKRTHEMNVEEMANFITVITATMADFGNPMPIREDL
jgi:hypothetical protein